MADKVLELKVKVNSETGQLDVAGAKLEQMGSKAEKTGKSFEGLTGQAGGLLKSFLPFATAGGILAFFTSAVKAAEEENEALRRLKFNLEAAGVSWDANAKKVNEWASSIQNATRFSDTEALSTLERLVRVTGDLGQAQSVTRLAMNLSVASGKDMATVTGLLADLYLGNTSSLITLNREFGAFTGNGKTAQEVIDNLVRSTARAAEQDDSFTKSTKSLSNAWGDFSEQIGRAIIPGLTGVIELLQTGIAWIDRFATGLAGAAAIAVEAISGNLKLVKAFVTRDFSSMKDIVKQTWSGITTIIEENAAQQAEIMKKAQADLALEEADRIAAKQANNEEEIKKREEANQRLLELEQQLSLDLLAVNQETLDQKLAFVDAEEQAKIAKINREQAAEANKERAIASLQAVYAAKRDKLRVDEGKKDIKDAETKLKLQRATAFETADVALQAIAIVNNMQEGHTKAQVVRAKAILALEKSIAIAKAIAAAQSAGPGAAALAAAQVALIVAQFAQQSKAIDQAAAAANSGSREFSTSTSLPGGTTVTETFTEGGAATRSSGGAFASSSGGGGGGGGAIINVGGVVVNFSADTVDLSTVEQVARRLGEEVLRRTTEGVQLAVAIRTVGDQNSNLAV